MQGRLIKNLAKLKSKNDKKENEMNPDCLLIFSLEYLIMNQTIAINFEYCILHNIIYLEN